MQPACGQSLLVEKNGDVYSCDHFVSPEYKLGNLTRDAMAALADSPFQRQFGQQKARLSAARKPPSTSERTGQTCGPSGVPECAGSNGGAISGRRPPLAQVTGLFQLYSRQ